MTLTGKLLIAAAAVAAFSGSAMAADLYVPPAAAAAPVASSTNWDGAYIGATLGYGWGTFDNTTAAVTQDVAGGLVGAQIGYNFHVADQFVLGVQGDVTWLNENATDGLGNEFKTDWSGALLARAGIDVGGVLPYVEAGVAFANATITPAGGAAVSNTHTGYVLGAGVEFMLADQVSANIEYRYNNYGSQTYGVDTVALTDNQIRVGLNYHF
jgi:opacity protein-like surface antigen